MEWNFVNDRTAKQYHTRLLNLRLSGKCVGDSLQLRDHFVHFLFDGDLVEAINFGGDALPVEHHLALGRDPGASLRSQLAQPGQLRAKSFDVVDLPTR